MNKIVLILIIPFLIGCSASSIDKETLSELTQKLNCENITTGLSNRYDTNEGATKVFTITVYEPKDLNVNIEEELREPSIYIVSRIFYDLSNIDTTYSNVHVTYSKGEDESTVDFTLDELYSAVGMNYFTNRNLVMGFNYLTQAIKWNPLNPDHYNNRAVISHSLKDYESALVDFKRAYELKPNNAELLRAIASCYLEMNDLLKTKEIIDKSITLDPKYASPYAVRARFYKKSLKMDSSIIDFKKAISLDPTPTNWYRELSEVYFENNDFKNALETIQDYLAREPMDGEGYLLKGRIYLKIGDIKSACAAVEKASELGTNDSKNEFDNLCGK